MKDTKEPTPFVFLPYQQKWAGDVAQVKLIEKSRRVGLSWSEAGDDTLFAAGVGGTDVWYIGYNKDMAEEFINDCAGWAKKYVKVVGEIGEIKEEIVKDQDKDILTFRIRFSSGKKIVALSSRPSNLRGKAGRVVIDEAAFHEDLKELIKAAIALLIWGGQVRIISTHNGSANYFNTMIEEIRAGRLPYSLHRVTLDDALSQGLYKRICLKLGREWSQDAQDAWRAELVKFYGDGADEELFCIPSEGSGTYLTRVMIENCMSAAIPVVRYEQTDAFKYKSDDVRESVVSAWCAEVLAPILETLDPKRECSLGEDFGRTGDLTVLVPLQETQQGTFRAPCIVELRNMPFSQQEQIVFYVIDNFPRFHHASFDARGNGQYLAERAAQKYGAERVSEIMPSETWYRENMAPYKCAFEDKTILLPKDADIIEDHRAFKVIKGVGRLPEGKTNSKKSKQRHGDSGVAGAMAWHATRQEGGGDTEYKTVAKRRFSQKGAW